MRPALALASLIWAGCSSTEVTQLVVLVDSDFEVPREMSSVQAVVEGTNRREHMFALASGPAEGRFVLPLSFGVTRGSEELTEVTIEIRGLSISGATLISRKATTGFIEGKSVLLPMYLARTCFTAPACPNGQTCTEDGCQNQTVDPGKLPVVVDPGQEIRYDAGLRPRDAEPSPDVETFDAEPEDIAPIHPDAEPIDDGVFPDADPIDSGVWPDADPIDGGIWPDAAPIDTGIAPDTGVRPDTGVLPDSGVIPDGGVMIQDAGPPCPVIPMATGYLQGGLIYNGNGWGFLWRDFVGGILQTHFALLDPNGQISAMPGPIDISDDGARNTQDVDLAFSGAQYGAAWQATSGGGIVFQRIAGIGARVGANIPVNASPYGPSIAYNTSTADFGIAWFNNFARVDANSMVSTPVQTSSWGSPSLIWDPDRSRYVLLSYSSDDRMLELRYLNSAGAVTNTSIIYTAPAGFHLDTNAGNENFPLVYNAALGSYATAFRLMENGSSNIYSASIHFLRLDLATSNVLVVQKAPQSNYGLREPTLTAWDNGYGMAYSDRVINAIMTVHMDGDGNDLGTRRYTCAGSLIYPQLGWATSFYVGIWNISTNINRVIWVP